MQMLRAYFKGFGEISMEDMDFLVHRCTEKALAKGEKLIRPHQHVDSIYFIASGFLHYFSHNEFGERTTLKVISPNHCWTIMDSFFHQRTTLDECQALTDVSYCELKRSDYTEVKLHNKDLANFIQTVTEYILSSKVVEENKKSKMSIEERYLDLLQYHPDMVQQVPVNIIASYIGTSRETLHRIRRKLTAA
ncbi:MAG: Crp/Fnr family transcriptional regulator [Bacteroidota bacterium]